MFTASLSSPIGPIVSEGDAEWLHSISANPVSSARIGPSIIMQAETSRNPGDDDRF
jgi:hypothetical protein